MRSRLLLLLIPLLVSAGRAVLANDVPPVATFSIVAVDPDTGEIGVAVQSKIVGVGAIVPFARAGVGAVATQAYANTGYGPLALQAMEAGMSARDTVNLLITRDPLRESRQVGVIAADGTAAQFTGHQCHGWAGGEVGEHFAVQGNILTGAEVVEAMAEAFRESEGVLAERLIAALRAGQEAGGDRRGRQSAALLVVREGWGYGGIGDRFRDVRVDDHETPVEELEKVYQKHRALFPRPE